MNIIYEGTLKQNEQRFQIAPLSLEHIQQILSLQNVVIETLENKDILQPLTLEEYQYILDGNGLMIGAFVDQELIAFRALLAPPIDDEHLGFDIGLTEDDLDRVIYQEISNVHPKCRGNGMQKILAKVLMEQLTQTDSKYDYVCCTVAPFNIPSLKDKFAQGMEIAALKEKYGGNMRYVFVKELRENEKKERKDIKSIAMSDIAGQQVLLVEGYRGYEMEQHDVEYCVRFGK
ncbi:N-acetyltransferase [Bacillus pseudomycoides]|uniref:N-acetyltransferase n=1 Tax=Bacillus pseudomycoides TaxID=64104 RepID=UPI000BEBB941|nr:N-acetyltransferase [Bacillus pseudomycoides]PEE40504.1 N-acetyltransferase [Bacillus pseudomycoides]PGA92358.1 N-acetyltransferase [Bacillus pseudomycoides]PHF46203.1 N-acetyltransferase [Bacillus pseudomycoides]